MIEFYLGALDLSPYISSRTEKTFYFKDVPLETEKNLNLLFLSFIRKRTFIPVFYGKRGKLLSGYKVNSPDELFLYSLARLSVGFKQERVVLKRVDFNWWGWENTKGNQHGRLVASQLRRLF